MTWVYKRTGMNPPLYTVGFYTPDGKWESESDHSTAVAAAEVVNWLNGGPVPTLLRRTLKALNAQPRFSWVDNDEVCDSYKLAADIERYLKAVQP